MALESARAAAAPEASFQAREKIIQAARAAAKGRKRCGLRAQSHREAPARKGREPCQRRKSTNPSNEKSAVWPMVRQIRAGVKASASQWRRFAGDPYSWRAMRTERSRQARRSRDQRIAATRKLRKP